MSLETQIPASPSAKFGDEITALAIPLIGADVARAIFAYNVSQVGQRQAITPSRMLGRMNATMRLIVWGTIPVGSLIGGVLGNLVGLVSVLWVSAIGGSLAFLPVLFSPVRSLHEIPAQAAE